jgi:hypothetical protein
MQPTRVAHVRLVALLAAPALVLAACVGATGGETVDFPVAAAGPEGAVAGQPLACAGDAN